MSNSRISIGRLSLTGALSMLALFVACWLGASAVNLPVTHMFIGLFTTYEIASVAALCVGGAWAFIWGAFVGSIVAGIYNVLGFMDRGQAPAARAAP